MEISRGMPAVRPVARGLALFFGSCAAGAMGTAWLAWRVLPYEQLRRFAPEEQFLAWEGVVWLVALAGGLLGLACALQVVGWRLGRGVAELVRHLTAADPGNRLGVASAVLPWWMMTYALFLILVAGLARSSLAP